MARSIFVNLPVKDVAAARAFWAELGFGFHEEYCDAHAACLVLEPGSIFAMLIAEPRFQDFNTLAIADAFTVKEVLTCLTCDDRGEVDALLAKAIAAGAKEWKPAFEAGPMYAGSFQDPDGHVWELMAMGTSD